MPPGEVAQPPGVSVVGFTAAMARGCLGGRALALGRTVKSPGPTAWVGPGGALDQGAQGARHLGREPPGCARREPRRPRSAAAQCGWRWEARQRVRGPRPGCRGGSVTASPRP